MSQLPPRETNPANPAAATPQAKQEATRKRIPMSVPTRKLEVNEIPGYRQYWFLETRVPRAIQGGYEFVDPSEVSLNPITMGSPVDAPNASMGSRVMVVAGEVDSGRAMHLVLMKIKLEWYLEDQKLLEEKNMAILDTIRKKKPITKDGELAVDMNKRYVRQADFTQTNRRT